MWLKDFIGDIKRIEKDEALKYIVGAVLMYLWKKTKPVLQSAWTVMLVLYVLLLVWLDDKGIIKMAEWKKQGVMVLFLIAIVLLVVDKMQPQALKTAKQANLQA